MNVVQEDDGRIDSRSDLYRWFSSVFAQEQTRASWDVQTSPEFLELLEARAREFGLGEPAVTLASYLTEHAPEHLDELLLDLAVDFAQLFIGPGPGKAPPYESVFTSQDGRLYGDAYADVIETLRREGIGVADGFAAPADHAAVELAVVAHLIDRVDGDVELPATAAPDAEASFLQSHVLNWFPRWLEHVEREAATLFYRSAAQLLAAFLEREKARLEADASG